MVVALEDGGFGVVEHGHGGCRGVGQEGDLHGQLQGCLSEGPRLTAGDGGLREVLGRVLCQEVAGAGSLCVGEKEAAC